MGFLYSLLIEIIQALLPITTVFSDKMKLFVDGRKNVFKQLAEKIKPSDQVIWLHAASLGEFEQGLPILEALQTQFPKHKTVVSFFHHQGMR